ncbi:DUF5691 domain-containing protein [Motilimonas eburnea]|uniref:DUF5691 domain-containing protein n=1 Tax=Motilimonas eburnea TaxID=1737488 RepID=UPI001E32FCC0|nr:DUF5691 domain-containing protein [Motilimonas eburnea]MCE2570533.1 DUF5691 domain-containing protein [Motilimonas eburnea]
MLMDELNTELINRLDNDHDNDLNSDLDKIDALFNRWLVGGNSTQLTSLCVPKSWPEFDSDMTQAQQRRQALIFATQQQAWLLTKSAPESLKVKATLPELELPAILPAQRGLFRRCLELIEKQQMSHQGHLLNLLLARGYTAHPADWLPKASDDVPAIYWPWCQWVADHANTPSADHQILTCETWDHFYPAQRLELLRAMRQTDAANARELITNCAAKEVADKRYKIVETLAIGLSHDDVGYLQSLGEDRSKKIVQLSQQLLMRLGITAEQDGEQQAALATELAQWFEIKTKGLLKKKTLLLPKPLKSQKQQALRSQWLEQVDLSCFAKALKLDLTQLISGWQFSDNRPHDNEQFVHNAVQTLPDDLIARLLDALLNGLTDHESNLTLIHQLLPRLDTPRRADLMLQLLQHKNCHFNFYHCLEYLDHPVEALNWQRLKQSQAWQRLSQDLREQLKDVSYIDNYYTHREIIALGLLVPASCAQELIKQFNELGLLNVDPILDLLKLNIQLFDSTCQQV